MAPELPPPVGSAAALMAALRARPPRAHEATTCYYERRFRRPVVKVLPGQFFVGDQDLVITTTLGSCVAACLHDPSTGLGGMNHFMLPEGGDASAPARFGPYAMELLIDELLQRGAQRASLEARLFGGGSVMPSLANTAIGEHNVAFAERFLARQGIPLRGRDVLDVHPRRVCVFPHLGIVLCRRLEQVRLDSLVPEDEPYRAQPRRQAGGEVELFT